MNEKQLWISEGIKAYIPEGIYLRQSQQDEPNTRQKQTAQNSSPCLKENKKKQDAIKDKEHQIVVKKIETSAWEDEQLETLLNLFIKLGPKWNIISRSIPNKSNNTIKNKFYGKLRKVTRKLNQLKKDRKILKKTIKYESVLRIIQPSKCLMNLDSQLRQKCEQLRLKIIDLVKKSQEVFNLSEVQILIDQINKFNLKTRSYRTKKSNAPKKKNNQVKNGQEQEVVKIQQTLNKQSIQQPKPIQKTKKTKNILISTPQVSQNYSSLNPVKIEIKSEQMFMNSIAFPFPYFRFNFN